MNISMETVDSKTMRRISKTMALKFNLVMIRDEEDKITAYTDKINMDKKLYLNLVFSKDINFKKGDKRIISNMIKSYYETRQRNILSENYIETQLDKMLEKAIDKGSSDIHIEPYKYFSNIRFRINGELIIIDKLATEEYLSLINRIKVLAAMDIANRLEPQDGKLTLTLNKENYDIRVSSIPTTNGEKIVLRILYKDESLNKIENLNFSDKQKDQLRKILSLKRGMIIINGPTGSGKSTTLYACLNALDKEKLNISTVEDPVEFDIPLITQSNVNEKLGFDFSKALKYILRQDPDVILIGEIRDEDTAKMATRAAVTGHKVLSTIHTSSGKEVYYRLLNMGVDKYLLDDSLVGIVTQRLLKILCDNCKEIANKIEDYDFNVYKHKGCELCNQSGYMGRTMVAEVVDLSTKDKEYIDDFTWGEQMHEEARELLRNGKIGIEDYLIFKNGELLID